MTDPFKTQQTIETFRQNAELREAVFNVSDEVAEQHRREYRAEKIRRFKLSLIRNWRAKWRAAR